MRMLNALEFRAGILIPEGKGDQYSLPHKLQEFMAAGHLTNPEAFEDFETAAAALVDGRPDWEEIVTLAAGIQAHVNNRPPDARKLAVELCASPADATPVALRRAVVAADILRDLGLVNVENLAKGPECLKTVRARLDMLAQAHPALKPKPRAEAAAARGWLEDLPRGVGCWPAANGSPALPDLEFVAVAGGDFVMGSRPGDSSYEGERPQFTCALLPHAFQLSRYPVTVAQFEAFIAAGGYGVAGGAKPPWWTDEGWQWREVGERERERPADYDAVFQTPNHPRVGVSWYEAHAFCGWLHGHRTALGVPVAWHLRLPWEAEWERAARGTTGRLYPWGAEAPEGRCNFNRELGHTSAVGLFLAGDAIEGPGRISDLAGNVWEWCATKWRRNYDEYEQLVNQRAEGTDLRVVRGGSWFGGRGDVRASYRRRDHPVGRDYYLGFRVAASPFL